MTKRLFAIMLSAIAFLFCLSACGKKAEPVVLPTAEEEAAVSDGTTQDTPLNDLRPMVMLSGKMYYDTGKISTIDGRCGVMDGEITSTVDGTKAPTEDNQSNFGSGYEYQFMAENTVEIIINEKWCVFEYISGD